MMMMMIIEQEDKSVDKNYVEYTNNMYVCDDNKVIGIMSEYVRHTV